MAPNLALIWYGISASRSGRGDRRTCSKKEKHHEEYRNAPTVCDSRGADGCHRTAVHARHLRRRSVGSRRGTKRRRGARVPEGPVPKDHQRSAPIACGLNFMRTNILLAGLGSYIVNAQGGCNDCHTSPPYAPGGDPFQGEPERINAADYMAGGMDFGPFVSRNITSCANGRPAGLTFAQFVRVMQTGVDLKDGRTGPPNTPILQVMPWPVYGNMSRCDLRAIYEFLRAIPPHDNQGCTPGGP